MSTADTHRGLRGTALDTVRPWRWAMVIGTLAFATLALHAQPLTGGGFTLVGAPAAAASLAGGSFRLTGYVAAAGADTSSGEDFDLTCGLIGMYGGPGDLIALQAELTFTGEVRLWWPATAAGMQLEFTTTVGPDAAWQPVTPAPAGHEYLTTPVPPARFFRLRQP